MSTINYPNGQTLTSTALSDKQVTKIVQGVTLSSLGTADPSLCRYSWPANGQPDWLNSADIVFLRCTQTDGSYNRVRNLLNAAGAPNFVLANWQYTRIWDIQWTAYGPNATDRIRAIQSALWLDWVTDAYSAQNLYCTRDIAAPTRAPELFQGQWWERVDVKARFYENVNEQLSNLNAATSFEIIIEDVDGIEADFTVPPNS